MKLLELISEKEIKDTLISEYEKKLVLYKLTNESLKNKYGMSFKEFEDNNIVKQKDFSWEVENDAMEWEHALDGIKTLKNKIIKIREMRDGN